MIADGVNLLSIALLGISAVLTAIGLLVKKRFSKEDHMEEYLKLKPLPGPRSFPLLGSVHIIGRYTNPWDGFSELRKQYGDIYGLKLGSMNCVVVSSVDGIKEVLSTKGNQFENRLNSLRFHAIFRGNRDYSIALCDWSARQKTKRKIAYPFMHPRPSTFGGAKLNMFITRELEELVRTLQPLQNQVIELKSHLLVTTANIFFQFLCSKRFSPNDERFCKVVTTFDDVFHILFQGFAVDFMPWLKVFNTRKLNTLIDMAKSIPEFTDTIFKERREYKGERHGDLMDLLMENAENTTKDEVTLTQTDVEVIVDDLLGGIPVLTNSWVWGLNFLADHPEVRTRIRKEVAEVTQNSRHPTMDDIGAMPYSFATIMELFRILCSPVIPHIAAEDTSIMGYKVYKDTMVLFNIVDINLNPKYWDHPRLFKPERFLDEEGKVRKPDYFFPFSIGKRSCIGGGLVKNILFLGFTTLLQCFDVVLPPDTKGPSTYDIPGDLLPKSEIKVVFKPIS